MRWLLSLFWLLTNMQTAILSELRNRASVNLNVYYLSKNVVISKLIDFFSHFGNISWRLLSLRYSEQVNNTQNKLQDHIAWHCSYSNETNGESSQCTLMTTLFDADKVTSCPSGRATDGHEGNSIRSSYRRESNKNDINTMQYSNEQSSIIIINLPTLLHSDQPFNPSLYHPGRLQLCISHTDQILYFAELMSPCRLETDALTVMFSSRDTLWHRLHVWAT